MRALYLTACVPGERERAARFSQLRRVRLPLVGNLDAVHVHASVLDAPAAVDGAGDDVNLVAGIGEAVAHHADICLDAAAATRGAADTVMTGQETDAHDVSSGACRAYPAPSR